MGRHLTQSQVRYLWAIGYFKGAKSSKKPVSTPSKEFKSRQDANSWAKENVTTMGKLVDRKDRLAVHTYSSEEYRQINDIARGKSQEGTETYKPVIDRLDKVISTSVGLPESVILYKGVHENLHNDIMGLHSSGDLIGAVISDKAFLSTSLVQEVGEGFLKYPARSSLLRITAPKGTKGVHIPSDESEYLLGRSTRLRITGIDLPTPTRPHHIVYAEVVN